MNWIDLHFSLAVAGILCITQSGTRIVGAFS